MVMEPKATAQEHLQMSSPGALGHSTGRSSWTISGISRTRAKQVRLWL